ncbi:MAG: hypothetical protein K2G11_06505 [Muribaculaceae bacterium]|nr:hypothetical protein [Muribaculaceae bacterium]
MADNKQPQQPRNIFEAINQNIVFLSQDLVELYRKVDEIHAALFPPQTPIAEPDVPGAETEE